MKLREFIELLIIIAIPLLLVLIILSYLAKKGKCPFCSRYGYYYDDDYCCCDDDECCCDDDECCCDDDDCCCDDDDCCC
ncbi:MAG: hypothetical protein GX362_04905, partial [Methanosarcinaceae archaeon]|nr:hypothetical protein [Methanosarcinaceae archaeon]